MDKKCQMSLNGSRATEPFGACVETSGLPAYWRQIPDGELCFGHLAAVPSSRNLRPAVAIVDSISGLI
jgi:hypothetical protein